MKPPEYHQLAAASPIEFIMGNKQSNTQSYRRRAFTTIRVDEDSDDELRISRDPRYMCQQLWI